MKTFLSKDVVLSAYKVLSKLDPEHKQGAVQLVSAIRYFVALDRFYKLHGKGCNVKNKADKEDYIKFVGEVVSVCDNFYLNQFYYPLVDHKGDFSVGSNFFSVNVVRLSLENSGTEYTYPKSRTAPLFTVKGGQLIREASYYKNFSAILGANHIAKVALAIWLLRNTPIENASFYNSIKEELSMLYTNNLVDLLIPDASMFDKICFDNNFVGFTSSKADITDKDIKNLFFQNNNENMPFVSIEQAKYLSALRTKPFLLLAGISGTGKSRIVRKLAQATVTEELQKKYDKEYKGTDFENDRWKLHRPANFELIQVKPNWHNSMDVLGYLSNIPSPHYVFTPFVNFIIKAWANPEVPFFLCLDEMNLAPVEEYFAEFLSAIESRSKESGKYETDPIIKPFNEFGKMKDEKGVEFVLGDMMINDLLPDFKASDANSPLAEIVRHLKEKGLTLPENLLVIGTVNMDETTFSFSRKVLDRAMSIEMNEVDYSSFLAGSTDDGLKAMVKKLKESNDSLANLLVNRHIEAREVVRGLGREAQNVIDYLDRINRLLDGTPFKLGYRAANEALIYLQSVLDFGAGGLTEALDQFTLMKILSRIEGDETKLKITNSASDEERIAAAEINKDAATQHGDLTLLTALRYIITETLGEYYQETVQEPESSADEPEQDTEQETTEEADVLETDEETVPAPSAKKAQRLEVVKKLDSMISQLKRDHFVSFWN